MNLQEIKKTIEELLDKVSAGTKVVDISFSEKTIAVDIQTEEPNLLIGQDGKTLQDIQHLFKVLIKKKEIEDFFLDIDINGYKRKKTEYLKDLARLTANEVAFIKKEKQLTPMSSYERRIIHMELAERFDIKTESVGEGEERKIVIKPV